MNIVKHRIAAVAVAALLALACLAAFPVFGVRAAGDPTFTPVTAAQYGQTVDVTVDTDGMTGVTGAKLYYTTYGGSTAFRAVDMTLTGTTYAYTVPASMTVVPNIYYYIELTTDVDPVLLGSAAAPYRMAVAPKTGYTAPKIAVTEAIAISGNRADFIELKNTSNAPIELSKLSLKIYEMVYQTVDSELTFVKADGNYKGEVFLATKGTTADGKTRITTDNEKTIQPGETFVVFTGKTASQTYEQGGLATTAAAYNYDYLRAQYTANRVGANGSMIEDLADIEDTRAFLTVSDPWTADSAVMPDPSANYKADTFGTLWEIWYDGDSTTSVLTGANNDGSVNLTDKSTTGKFAAAAGFGSVQYSPYAVEVTQGGQTINVQSRLTDAREVGISMGTDRKLPSVSLTTNAIDLTSATEQKEVDLTTLLAFDNGMYYGNEYTVSYRIKKDNGDYAAVSGATATLDGVGEYTVEVSIAPWDVQDPIVKEVTFEALADTVAPTIANVQETGDKSFGSTFTVSATVTDNVELSEETPAVLYYKTIGNAAYKTAAMTSDGDVFSASVAGIKSPVLFYYIEATDKLDNKAQHGSAAEPKKVTFTPSATQAEAPLIITEANVIRSRRADFIEVYNNGNKPVALSKVTLKRFDSVVTSGAFKAEFLANTTTFVSTLATSTATDTEGTVTEITAANEVYVQPGQTFVIFVGNLTNGGTSPLAQAPYNVEFIKNFYREGQFTGIDLTKLEANVNAFMLTTPLDPSPTYSAGAYGTAFRIEYDGAVSSTVILGMDNDGSVVTDDASTGTVENTVGSVQCSYYTNDVMLGGETVTVQSRMSDNKQAVISFNTVYEGQTPAERYAFRPEVTLTKTTDTVYSTDPIDLTDYLTVQANGYEDTEFAITAFAGSDPIADLTAFVPSVGSNAVRFHIASTATPAAFEAYDVTLTLTAVNTPGLTVTEADSMQLLYGQVDSIDVSDLYTVTDGAFAGQYDVNITSNLPLVNNKIMIAGSYVITVTVTPKTAGAFEPISKTINLTVTAKTVPSVTGDTTANGAIAGDTFDLSTLFTVDKHDFTDAVVTYAVTKDSQAVTVTGTTIPAVAGTYSVTVSVAAANDEFETVSATTALTLSMLAPSVTGSDASFAIKDVTAVDVSTLFSVQANSYAGKYTVAYTATRNGAAITLTDGSKLPLIRGEYRVTATVQASDASFNDVTHTITVTLQKTVPTVTAGQNETVQVGAGEAIDVAGKFTVAAGDYAAGEYTVAYSVTLNGAAVTMDGTTFKADAAGTYKVTVTVTAADGSFEAVSASLDLTVELTGSDKKGCGCGGAAVGTGAGFAGAVALLAALVLVMRKKKQQD